jgi:protein-S-isoprenylcysteine O-methyltransferase Ste14
MKSFALVRTLVVGMIFLSFWLWWLPRWLGWPMHVVHPEAWAVFAIGLDLGFWCAVEFALRGLGTPAPFDPPKRLVITGLYRFVRNPMYVGLGIALVGEAWLTGRIEFIYEMVVLWTAVAIMVIAYEEPALRRQFGGDYVGYCRHVPRWIPRLTPFDKA